MNGPSRLPWYALLACVGLAPLATTATSMTLSSLPLTYDSYVIPKLAALGVLTAVALAAWLAGGGRLRHHPGAWALAALLGLAAAATAFALDPAVAVFGKDAANGLVAYLCYGAVFMLVLAQATTTARVTGLARAVVGSGALAAAASLYQAARMTTAYVASLGLDDAGFLYGRGGGLFGNPDFVGAYLVVPLVLGIGLTLAERDRAWRAASAVATLLVTAALVVTQVRAGWMGAAVGVAALVALSLPRAQAPVRRQMAIAAGVLVAALALGVALIGPAGIAGRLAAGMDEGLDAVSAGRLSGWRDAAVVIADRPLLGTGPDSFTFGWYRHATSLADPLTGARSYFEDPHNVYLAIAATMGVPAALALLALIVLALRAGAADLAATRERPEARTVFAAWLAAFAGLLVTALFAVTTIPTMLLLFVAAAALLAPQARTVEGGPAPELATRVSAGVLALTVAGGALVPILADRQLGEYLRTGRMDILERARSIAPWDKTIQTQYLATRRAQLADVIESGSAEAVTAVLELDAEMFRVIEAHPYELSYVIERLDFLGQSAGLLGPAIGEKALTVSGLAAVDYPRLADFAIYRARALNNLERYEEAAALLGPMERSVSRDMALAETLLLLGDEDGARTLAREIAERYPNSSIARAFIAQPTIAALLGG